MMTHRKLVGVLALCMACIGCSGSDHQSWVFVATTKVGRELYDQRSVRTLGDTVMVNATHQIPKDDPENQQRIANGLPSFIDITNVMQFDCEKRILINTHYVINFSNGTSSAGPDDQPYLVLPNAPEEKIMDFACLPAWRRSLTLLIHGH